MTRKSFLALLSGIAAWFAVKPKSLPPAAKVSRVRDSAKVIQAWADYANNYPNATVKETKFGSLIIVRHPLYKA